MEVNKTTRGTDILLHVFLSSHDDLEAHLSGGVVGESGGWRRVHVVLSHSRELLLIMLLMMLLMMLL